MKAEVRIPIKDDACFVTHDAWYVKRKPADRGA